jgi:hypothetical protein
LLETLSISLMAQDDSGARFCTCLASTSM